MTTDSSSNVYISNGQLYIMPTLTSDTIDGGYASVMDNASYTLPGCTADTGQSPFIFTTYLSILIIQQPAWTKERGSY